MNLLHGQTEKPTLGKTEGGARGRESKSDVLLGTANGSIWMGVSRAVWLGPFMEPLGPHLCWDSDWGQTAEVNT